MKIYTGKNIEEIENRISKTENLTIFQTKYFYYLYNSVKETSVHYIIVEEDNEIKALMLVQVQNYFFKLASYFTKRSVIIGAPLIFDYSINTLNEILRYYEREYGKKLVYTQIRNLFDTSEYKNTFLQNGYEYIPHLNYIIDLKQSEEELWARVYSKRRNEIRRAEKEGVAVREINYDAEFELSYNILSCVYKKAKMPIPSFTYFTKAKEILNEKLKIYGGFLGDKLIGVMYVLCFNGRVYDWYAGSDYEYVKFYPNDIITWEVIKKAKEDGYDIFDFGA